MKLFCLCLSLFFISCGSNCDKLPNSFTSYSEAISKIRSTYFKINEKANTSTSSWVRGAEYFSCDGSTGYFIITTDNGDYIYKNMPVNVWSEFKNASSFGSYYDHNIKGRYQLPVSNK